MTFDYNEYSLKNLEEWVHDSMNSEASPSKIYDCIYNAICEDYYYHKHHASRAYELMMLMNGNRHPLNQTSSEKPLTCDKDDESDECKTAWEDFWESNTLEEESAKKWVLSIEEDAASDDLYITFPEDLLKSANLKEGDWVNWVENSDGTWTLKKKT